MYICHIGYSIVGTGECTSNVDRYQPLILVYSWEKVKEVRSWNDKTAPWEEDKYPDLVLLLLENSCVCVLIDGVFYCFETVELLFLFLFLFLKRDDLLHASSHEGKF